MRLMSVVRRFSRTSGRSSYARAIDASVSIVIGVYDTVSLGRIGRSQSAGGRFSNCRRRSSALRTFATATISDSSLVAICTRGWRMSSGADAPTSIRICVMRLITREEERLFDDVDELPRIDEIEICLLNRIARFDQRRAEQLAADAERVARDEDVALRDVDAEVSGDRLIDREAEKRRVSRREC